MKNLITKLMLSGFLLTVTSACVMTPMGDVIAPPIGVSAEVDLTPHYVYRNRSSVSISIGPDYTIGDAFLLADNHCSSYGYYAVPRSDWDWRYDSVRRVEYYCRRNSTYLPPVFISSPGSRYYGRPYRLYNDPHPRYNHGRPHHDHRYDPTPRPNGGWWSRNQNDNRNLPTPPPPPSTPRATTPQSPWSYNPRKDDDRRYNAPTPPRYDNRNDSRGSGSSSNSGGGFWGNNRGTSSPSTGSSSSSGSYSSPSSSGSSSSGSSSSSSSAPGWWGKNKK